MRFALCKGSINEKYETQTKEKAGRLVKSQVELNSLCVLYSFVCSVIGSFVHSFVPSFLRSLILFVVVHGYVDVEEPLTREVTHTYSLSRKQFKVFKTLTL